MKKRLFSTLFLSFLFAGAHALAQEDSIVGVASYYANRFHGRKTASGERYDKNDYTCAHMKFKFGTKLLVRNLKNGKEVVVRVTDRGPYSKKYSIDLSYAAAEDLDIIRAGHAKVAIFPYDESKERKPPVRIPSFLEFSETIGLTLPNFELRDTIKIHPQPLPLPVPDSRRRHK